MANIFQPYTHAIVGALIKMERPQSRAWFVAILKYICHETGEEVASIHDYVTKPVRSATEENERREILAAVARALQSEDLAALSGEIVAP